MQLSAARSGIVYENIRAAGAEHTHEEAIKAPFAPNKRLRSPAASDSAAESSNDRNGNALIIITNYNRIIIALKRTDPRGGARAMRYFRLILAGERTKSEPRQPGRHAADAKRTHGRTCVTGGRNDSPFRRSVICLTFCETQTDVRHLDERLFVLFK